MGVAEGGHLDPAQLVAYGAGRGADPRWDEHLVACDHCWTEVRAARAGRLAAEQLRDVAPPELRDRLTSAVSCSEGPGHQNRPRRRLFLAAGVAAVLVLLTASSVVALRRRAADRDRSILSTLVASAASGSHPPAVVRQADQVAAMSTVKAGGVLVVIARLATPFPMPPGAAPMTAGQSPWVAMHGHIMVLGLDQPRPLLAAAALPADQLMRIARQVEGGQPSSAGASWLQVH